MGIHFSLTSNMYIMQKPWLSLLMNSSLWKLHRVYIYVNSLALSVAFDIMEYSIRIMEY